MNKIAGMILILAATVATLGSVAGGDEGRTLVGTVIDRDTGAPAASANVILEELGHHERRRGTITGADGTFRFAGLGPGDYRLDALYLGRQPMREGIRVDAGDAGDADQSDIEVKIQLRTAAVADPAAPDLVVLSGTGARLLTDLELARFVAGTNAPVRPAPTGPVKEFDIIAVEGAAVSVNTRETESVGKIGSEDMTDFAVDSVEKAVGRPAGVMGTPSTPRAELDAGTSAAVEALLAGEADELWILEQPSDRRPADPAGDPGTGCLVVIDDGKEIAVPLEHTDVRARIDGYMASVEVRQTFQNPFHETIEAEYIFPLPHDAAVNDFIMTIGERRIRGIIREKEEARQIYERARDAGFVASLLEQERPNIFRQRVANIEPGHRIDVELHYFNCLPYRDGAFEFVFPMVVGPRFNPPGSVDPVGAVPRGTQQTGTSVSYLGPDERSGHDVSLSVELDAGLRIEELNCLNHATRVRRDGPNRAHIELASADRVPNKDFVLSYRVASDAIKSEVLVHHSGKAGDGDYFSMLLVPPAELAELQRAPVEFVFVLDCSGSMSGWPMEKSKSAMRRALRQLQPGDSFQVIRFSEGASALGPVPVEATAQNIERGLEYVDALQGSGGTLMIEGIKAALDFPHDPERMRIVTFMTDGYIGNEAEIFAEIVQRLGPTRIFSFGVGQSVNRHLIEGMARMGKGAVAYIGLDDDLDAVDGFYQAVRHPALTDIRIDWGGMEVAQVFPQQRQDLFVGRPILLHGKCKPVGSTVVTVHGRAGGRDVEMRIKVRADQPVDRPALPLLWARSELQHIADRLTREADDSLQRRGTDLALNYNLLSAWTSFVAVDASAVVDEPGTRKESVPVPIPEGVRHDTTTGRQDR